jgi:hypothetical protein
VQLAACKKPEGPGGTSSITGKIWVKKISAAPFGEYTGAYEDVYIIYGSDAVSGNKIKTNPDGIYEFKYLEPGNYKVYVYTRDSTGLSTVKKLPIIKEIELKKKEHFDAGTIQVYR